MTAAPYTRETVRDIRAMVGQGASTAEVLKKLGWDQEFLKRVCRRHEIEFSWIPSDIVVAPPPPVRPLATRATAAPTQKLRPASIKEETAARSGPRRARYDQLTFSTSPEIAAAVHSRAKSLGVTRSEFLFRLVSTIHARDMWSDLLSSLRSREKEECS
ncbi:hypothetical protein [Pseudorhodoplanes sinuspersici]|uniref:Uncharacterized protein n=1 Tax=Pseudorhodoplanes sinuspersici TaxID=1235591 RepID=A0A1W6ZX61_9HYPH|nr:hypothetical protein [Pseudorhodoplanes sinuspersici]ARQ01900.1 hypothetical protein CAK95_24475 [Pseudorhodoplanes sinuspersici]RKE73666.1 hypothetical protein DFP91_1561 [Pseudorhodoplanes sinuspersici]